MSEIEPSAAKGWIELHQQVLIGYHQCKMRLGILVDYSQSLIDAAHIGPADLLQIANSSRKVYGLLAASDPHSSAGDAERHERQATIGMRIDALRSHIEHSHNHHPGAAKLLSHFMDLERDTVNLIELEMLFGREMADVCQGIGGSTAFRHALAQACPSMKWEDAESVMRSAMDSALAAKLDDEQ